MQLPILLLSACLLLLCTIAQAQEDNLFDQEHTELFSEYLMKTGQYQYACEELERLLFLDTDNDSIKTQLLKNYRLDRNFDAGIDRFLDFSKAGVPNMQQRAEYVRMLMLTKSFDRASDFLVSQVIKQCEREQGLVQMFALQQDWAAMEEREFGSDCFSQEDKIFYPKILHEGLNAPHKSPALATGLSAIVPGSGKVYTGEWKDGIMSFIFVASMAWQSYRGFDRKGTRSAYGWIFGGLAAGFYGGNLFGSHKSAVMHNERQKERLAKEIEAYIYSAY